MAMLAVSASVVVPILASPVGRAAASGNPTGPGDITTILGNGSTGTGGDSGRMGCLSSGR